MTPDRWRKIEELYQAAQNCGPGERAALLDGTDPEIRAHVERMLEIESNGGLLDQSPINALENPTETIIARGTQLGPYRIEAQIGLLFVRTVALVTVVRKNRPDVPVKVDNGRCGQRRRKYGKCRNQHAEKRQVLGR